MVNVTKGGLSTTNLDFLREFLRWNPFTPYEQALRIPVTFRNKPFPGFSAAKGISDYHHLGVLCCVADDQEASLCPKHMKG